MPTRALATQRSGRPTLFLTVMSAIIGAVSTYFVSQEDPPYREHPPVVYGSSPRQLARLELNCSSCHTSRPPPRRLQSSLSRKCGPLYGRNAWHCQGRTG